MSMCLRRSASPSLSLPLSLSPALSLSAHALSLLCVTVVVGPVDVLVWSPALMADARTTQMPVRALNLHEYQSANIMRDNGVNTPKGGVAKTPEDAEKIAKEIGGNDLVSPSRPPPSFLSPSLILFLFFSRLALSPPVSLPLSL